MKRVFGAVALNLGLVVLNLAFATVCALFFAWVSASIRGDMLPTGGTGMGRRSFWVYENFRFFLPFFLGGAAVLGTVIAQVQFLAWWSRPTRIDLLGLTSDSGARPDDAGESGPL